MTRPKPKPEDALPPGEWVLDPRRRILVYEERHEPIPLAMGRTVEACGVCLDCAAPVAKRHKFCEACATARHREGQRRRRRAVAARKWAA